MDRRIEKAISEGSNLLEPEAMALLGDYRLPVLPYHWYKSREEVLSAGGISFPAVVKVVSRHIVHKSEVVSVICG